MDSKIKISVTWSNGLTETRETNIKTFIKCLKECRKQDPKFLYYV